LNVLEITQVLLTGGECWGRSEEAQESAAIYEFSILTRFAISVNDRIYNLRGTNLGKKQFKNIKYIYKYKKYNCNKNHAYVVALNNYTFFIKLLLR